MRLKNLQCFVFAAVVLFSGFHFTSAKSEPHYCKLSDRLTNIHITEMKKEYGLQCVGIGGSYMNDVNNISLYYDLDKKFDIEHARKLVVKSADRLLELYNKDMIIREYLHNYPFNYNNIVIDIGFKFDPILDYGNGSYISAVRLSKGEVCYYETQDKLYSEIILEETCEEAKKLITQN